jgi:hypothetical protein
MLRVAVRVAPAEFAMATQFTTDSGNTLGNSLDLQSGLERESTMTLLRRLMDELVTLFRQEVSLATAEVTTALTKLFTGALSIAAGGAMLLGGFLVLLASAVLGLALVVEPWLAALIVGAVVSIIGFIMVYAGSKRLDPSLLKPRRSARSLQQDKDVLTRKTS